MRDLSRAGPGRAISASCSQPGGFSQVVPARWSQPGGPSHVFPARELISDHWQLVHSNWLCSKTATGFVGFTELANGRTVAGSVGFTELAELQRVL